VLEDYENVFSWEQGGGFKAFTFLQSYMIQK
jgi:hypothetical protein